MKKTVQIITTLLLTFIIPLITSLLLDWHWVAKAWPRYGLIVLLMLVQITIGAYIFKMVVEAKDPEKEADQQTN